MNTNIWKQSGRAYLWRYEDNPKNYRGWHFTADTEGVTSLLLLVDFLSQATAETKRTIDVSMPTASELSVPNYKVKAVSANKLIIVFDPGNDEAWRIISDERKVAFTVGQVGLRKFRDGLLDIQNGKGDYSIGDKGQEVWFWWRINDSNNSHKRAAATGRRTP